MLVVLPSLPLPSSCLSFFLLLLLLLLAEVVVLPSPGKVMGLVWREAQFNLGKEPRLISR